MAVYHTLFIECYREEDALRLHEQLKHWLWEVNGHSVSMAQCVMEPANGFWNVHANPLGPGYSRFGYVEGMNEPLVLEMLENELFKCIGTAPGIRRAACGYEAQDWFLNSYGELDRDVVNLSSLLYDRNLPLAGLRQTAEVGTVVKAKVGIVEFGPWYYRTLVLG